jgi:hypothetical protein
MNVKPVRSTFQAKLKSKIMAPRPPSHDIKANSLENQEKRVVSENQDDPTYSEPQISVVGTQSGSDLSSLSGTESVFFPKSCSNTFISFLKMY